MDMLSPTCFYVVMRRNKYDRELVQRGTHTTHSVLIICLQMANTTLSFFINTQEDLLKSWLHQEVSDIYFIVLLFRLICYLCIVVTINAIHSEGARGQLHPQILSKLSFLLYIQCTSHSTSEVMEILKLANNL